MEAAAATVGVAMGEAVEVVTDLNRNDIVCLITLCRIWVSIVSTVTYQPSAVQLHSDISMPDFQVSSILSAPFSAATITPN